MNNLKLSVTLFLVFALVSSCQKGSRPKADFTITHSNDGAVPDTLHFEYTGTQANSLSWNFGNGMRGAASTAEVIYTEAGVYGVTLTANGDGGADKVTKAVTITLQKPTANFSYTIVDNGSYPVHVLFDRQGPTPATQYRWSFDDGHIAAGISAKDSFVVTRIYNVTLIATNASGVDSIVKPVDIQVGPH